MKKLLDENTDDLTRALLEAGRSHRPPATNKAKLLVALGVGSSVGLLSSKAFAWLGTSTGKLTVLSVGVAGALYAGLSLSEGAAGGTGAERVEARLSPAVAPSAGAASAAQSGASNEFVPAHVADAPSHPVRDPVAGLPAVNEGPARRENAPVASESPHRTSRVRKGSAARRDDVRERLETKRAGALPAASTPPAGSTSAAPEPRAPSLESEIQLVDAMRGAAQRNDAQALRGLLESYRGSFPHGQLREEVAELALRALPARP